MKLNSNTYRKILLTTGQLRSTKTNKIKKNGKNGKKGTYATNCFPDSLLHIFVTYVLPATSCLENGCFIFKIPIIFRGIGEIHVCRYLSDRYVLY